MKPKLKEDKKGQIIIVSLLMFFVALVVVSTIMEPLVHFAEIGVNGSNSSVHALEIAVLLRYMPFFVVLVLLISLFLIISGR